jgi:hypothetical protein
MDVTQRGDMSNASAAGDELPWFLKVVIAVAILVILFVVGIDLLAFAEAL